MSEHEAGELMRVGQTHEMASDHRGGERPGQGAGEENQHGVENNPGAARFIHSHS